MHAHRVHARDDVQINCERLHVELTGRPIVPAAASECTLQTQRSIPDELLRSRVHEPKASSPGLHALLEQRHDAWKSKEAWQGRQVLGSEAEAPSFCRTVHAVVHGISLLRGL